jgi:hypothetical protein
MDKPFAKTARNIITCTIDENGDVIFIATDANDVFLNHGDVVTKRASHVLPENFWLRQAFRILRLFGDKTQLAEWTRRRRTTWLVDASPVGAPTFRGGWTNRQDAIDFEISFLNDWFLERGIR